MSGAARYDGHSEWYDETFSGFSTEEEQAFLRQCLGTGDGEICVDVGMFFHTDVADFAAVARDVARCLRPAGRFICMGLHPCFIGPFVDRTTESRDLTLSFAGGYGTVGWASRGSGDGSGVGGRVGFHHKSLEIFLGAIAEAGLNIRAVREFSGGGTVLPRNIGFVTQKN